MNENNFENVIIGSAFEGAEGMFTEKKEESGTNPDALRTARVERGIFEDARERYEKTITEEGLEHVAVLDNGISYPSLDEWIEYRIEHKRGTKFYPSFVRNEEGVILFCKTQVSENANALKGMENEANRLFNIPEGVRAPKIVKYLPPQDGKAAALIIEAVPLSDAMVKPPEKWSQAHASSAARQIKIMEQKPYEAEGEEFNVVEKAEDLLKRAGDTVRPEIREKIEAIFNQSSELDSGVFAHGDLCTKNILTEHDPEGEVSFVDWEFDGNGFVGQDAAKLYSELQKNEMAGRAFLDAYLHDGNGTLDPLRKKAIVFGTALESLVHLAWRKEKIIDAGKQTQMSNLEQQLNDLNARIAKAIEETEKIAQ